ncbi:MAG: NAD(P)-dependent oxidoreductase [Thermoproteota archaeon]
MHLDKKAHRVRLKNTPVHILDLMFKVWIAEPIPSTDVAIRKLRPYAEVEVSPIFYQQVPPQKLRGCSAVIIADSFLMKESLADADKLRIVQKFGVGFNTIAIEECGRRGIYVCNIPGINSLDVAEFVVGSMISSLRGFARLDSAARRGAWSERPNLVGERLSGKTVGIIGFGRIGREVARLLRPFNVKLLVYDPYVDPKTIEEGSIELVELKKLLSNSDIVTIHVPLTDETRTMIGARELRSMKSSSILINTSRGPVVDEEALHEALKEKIIKHAVIDVWSKEPIDPDNKILKLKNTQLSLHQASWTRSFFEIGMEFCADNILRVLRGEIPQNIVNKDFLHAIDKQDVNVFEAGKSKT